MYSVIYDVKDGTRLHFVDAKLFCWALHFRCENMQHYFKDM